MTACPACGSPARKLLFEGLADRLFGCPGSWAMQSCGACGAAYLDPRPTEASIGRAYQTYYTHQGEDASDRQPLARRGWKAALRNGYLNAAYGHRLPNASPFGSWALKLRPRVRRGEDFLIRHLPAPRRSGERFLDVGCGSGDFLPIAETLGYRATGVEPDPAAVAAGRALGREVSEGLLPGSGMEPAAFSQITLNHVFEHLHRPAESLAHVLELLEPGGRVWLSQPNLGAKGLQHFGQDWRGLEPPRHLTLYDGPALVAMLTRVGFRDARVLPAENAARFYYWQSYEIRARRDLALAIPSWRVVAAEADAADRLARRDPALAESVTVVAWKP